MSNVLFDDDGWDAVQAALDALTPPAAPAPEVPVTLGWASVPVMAPSGTIEHHCIPVNDIRPHMLAAGCPCGAVEDLMVDDHYAHTAWDGREAYEPGGKRRHN